MRFQTAILSIFSIACTISALAQPKTGGFNGNSNPLENPFKPKLIPASKLLLDPIIPQNSNQAISTTYNPFNFQWNTRKITRILPPVGHFEPGLDTSYNPNYVRIGGGMYAHKLLEGYLANRANKQWAYNLAVQHLSADQDNSLRDFSTTKAFLAGARFYKRSSLEMRFNYLRDMNKFFAIDSNNEKPAIKNLKKVGQNMGFNLLYDLKALARKPGFKVGFMFNNFYNNLNQSETEFGLQGGWDFVFQKLSTSGTFSVSNMQYRQNFTPTKQWFIDLNPRVKYVNKENGVEGNAGLNLTWAFKDTLKPVFYFNPYLYGEKKLEGLKMKVYGGLDGGLNRNSLRRFSEQVPFTLDTIRVLNTYTQLKGYAGLKGRITENAQFGVEFGGSSVANMPLIIGASDSIGALRVTYDDVNILYFSGDVRFSIGEKLRVGAFGKVNQYTPATESKAWHLPAANYAVNLQYLLNNQWIFQVGVDGMGKRYSKIENSSAVLEMKGFADLNARVDFKIKNIIRIWVQGSNLINQKYQVWYGYTSYRLCVLGGISASF